MPSQDLPSSNLDAASSGDAERGFGDYALRGLAVLALLGVALSVMLYVQNERVHAVLQIIGAGLATQGFWAAAGVGLLAQVVDGALGMAYGVTSTAFLMSVGVPPAAASASVHLAEVFTTGFSGLSHWRLGNVDAQLFRRLLIPGVLGALLGHDRGADLRRAVRGAARRSTHATRADPVAARDRRPADHRRQPLQPVRSLRVTPCSDPQFCSTSHLLGDKRLTFR
jgi:hypothetical protein